MVKTAIGYNDPSSTTATGQVRTWKSGATTYTYAYDARGKITSVSDGQSTTTYAYDNFDQLVRENNQAAGKTWTYAYDDGGNILSKTEYAYTAGTLGTAQNRTYLKNFNIIATACIFLPRVLFQACRPATLEIYFAPPRNNSKPRHSLQTFPLFGLC